MKSKSNETENAANSADHTNAHDAASADHKKAKQMGSVIVTYKVFPEDIVKDFEPMKKEIESKLPKFAEVTGYGQ